MPTGERGKEMTHYEEIVEAREKGYQQGKAQASGVYWLSLIIGVLVGSVVTYFLTGRVN